MSQTLRALPHRSQHPRTATLAIETTGTNEFVDITDRLADTARDMALTEGLLAVQTLHTTTGLLVNENEPLLLEDIATLLERWAPRYGIYAHDNLERRSGPVAAAERRNGYAHCRAVLLPTSVTLHVVDGALVLGPWQRVLLVEFDGPQERRLSILATGEAK